MIIEFLVGSILLILVSIISYYTPYVIYRIKFLPSLPDTKEDKLIYGFTFWGVGFIIYRVLSFLGFLVLLSFG